MVSDCPYKMPAVLKDLPYTPLLWIKDQKRDEVFMYEICSETAVRLKEVVLLVDCSLDDIHTRRSLVSKQRWYRSMSILISQDRQTPTYIGLTPASV